MLFTQINEDLKTVMKARDDKPRVAAIRMITAEMKKKIVDEGLDRDKPLDDTSVMAILTKMVKQREDAAATYAENDRQDLADKENYEISIIAGYLPKQMDEAEMANAVKATIAEIGAEGMKDMGKVMGALKGKYTGSMDFGKANGIVKAELS